MPAVRRNILAVVLNVAVLATFVTFQSFSVEAGARLVSWFAAMLGSVVVASWLSERNYPLMGMVAGLAMPTYVVLQLLSRPYPTGFLGAALAGALLCTLIVLFVPVSVDVTADASPRSTNPSSPNGPRS